MRSRCDLSFSSLPAPNSDTSNSGNINGSSVTPYGVIDTGVTRTINR